MTDNNLESLKITIQQLERAEIENKKLAASLRESEARFRMLYEKAPLGYQSLDENGHFIEVNPAWLEQLGYSREEVIGKSFGDFLHPDWKDHFKENFPRFKAVGEVLGVEFEIRKKDGAFILVSFNGKIGRDKDGNFLQTHCIFQDITEARRIEEEKGKNQEMLHRKLKAVLEPDGDIGGLTLSDILDIPAMRPMMAHFHALTKLTLAILDTEGNILLKEGFQDICLQFHRKHLPSGNNCLESDTVLASGLKPGEIKLYKCKNNMWDIATPIYVGGKHMGNVFTGQFFFDDESVDREIFRRQARKFGYNEAEYMASLDKVPRWSRENIQEAMSFLTMLAVMLSNLGFNAIRLARAFSEKDAALKKLQENEERYRELVEKVNSIILRLDPAGNIIFINEYAQKFFGYEAEYILGRNVVGTIVPETESSGRDLGAMMQNLLRDPERYAANENENMTRNGDRVWIAWTNREIFDAQGNIHEVLCVGNDITEQHKMQAVIREREELHRAIIRTAMDGFWIADTQGNLLEVNDTYCLMSGYTETELLSMRIMDLEAVETPEETAAHMKRIIGRGWDRFESRHRRKDGSLFEVEVSIQFKPEKGGISIVFIRDITDRKQKEDELRLQSLVLDQISDLVVITDMNGMITYVNQAEEKIMGMPKKAFIGKPVNIFGEDPAHGATQGEIVEKTLRNGMWRGEVVNITPNGSRRIMDCRTRIVYDKKGEPIALCGISTDITAFKHAEWLLRQSEKKYRLLANNIPDIIYTLDDQAKIIMINTPALARYGYEEKDIKEKTFLDFIHPDDREPVFIKMYNALAERETGRMGVHLRLAAADGVYYWFELNAKIHYDDNGIYLGEDGVLRDITERKISEANFRTFFESMTDMILVAAPDGRILAANKAVSLTLGYAPKEIPGMHILDLHSPDMHREVEETFAAMVRRERDTCPLPFMKKGGGLVPVETRVWFGQWSGMDCIFGISKNLSAEQEAHQRFERLFRNNPTLMAVSSIPDGVFIDVNEMFLETTGYTMAEVLGKRMSELGMMPDPDRHLALREQLKTDRRLHDAEMQIRCKDGSIRDGIFFGDIITSQGKDYAFTVMVDITERKQTETALRESETRFKALHNASFGGIAIHDKGMILECNQGMSDMTGYSPAELISMDGLLLIAEEDRDMVIKNILAGNEKPYEARGRRKNGEIFPMRLEARNIPYKGKQVRTVEFRNISEIKKADEEREKLTAQLHQAQKMESIGRLAGGVAHDFNNMLGVILANTEMAMEEINPDDPVLPYIKDIQSAAQRSSDVTRQLLAFARKQTIAPREIDLNATIESMINILSRLIGEDIDLSWMPAETLWKVKMDPSQIDQILANLCINARDAIKDTGEIVIETKNKVFDEDYCADHPGFLKGEFVLLAVSDNGSGMDTETLANLFEPFFTTKQAGKGTGLGLSMVYGIIQQNKGFINVYSEPDIGTVFNIYLPRYLSGKSATGEQKAIEASSPGHETILLVEDEPMFLDVIKSRLEKLGYAVLAASNPGDAIHQAREHAGQIDLLITDVVMPEMNGRDLAKNIMSLYPDIKRLFMSGYTADVIAHQGVLEEGVQFIQKPFAIKDLSAKIRETLGQ